MIALVLASLLCGVILKINKTGNLKIFAWKVDSSSYGCTARSTGSVKAVRVTNIYIYIYIHERSMVREILNQKRV
jgi:hypothetical protein